MHICVNKLTIIGSHNGFLPGQHQAIVWASVGTLFNGLLGTNLAQWLTHWGRVTHKCVNKLTIIGSDNGLSPGQRQAIIWASVGTLFKGLLGTNFSEILSDTHTFSFKKMHLKMSSAQWRQFCPGFSVLSSASVFSGWFANSFISHRRCWYRTNLTY